MYFSPIHPLFRVLFLSFPLSLLAAKSLSPIQEMTKTAIQTAHHQSQLQIEQYRNLADEEAKKLLVPEAKAVLEHTRKAVQSLPEDPAKALTAIEEARVNIERLFTRYAGQSFFPVDYRVEVIDTAPTDPKQIQSFLKKGNQTKKHKNLVESRFFFNVLRSEINTHLHGLPLENYAAALKEAVHQIQEKRLDEAQQILSKALHTFVISDRVVPLPLIQAETIFAAAEQAYPQDKTVTIHLINAARHELERAHKLGYIDEDQQFALLNKSIEDFVRHTKSNKNSDVAFHSLKEKMSGLAKKLTRTLTHSFKEDPASPG